MNKVNAVASGGKKKKQPHNRENEDGLRRNVWLQKAS